MFADFWSQPFWEGGGGQEETIWTPIAQSRSRLPKVQATISPLDAKTLMSCSPSAVSLLSTRTVRAMTGYFFQGIAHPDA